MDRREFLALAGCAATPLFAHSASVERPALPFHAVLVDERHAAGRAFGTQLARQGAALRALADYDVTDLWLREIAPVWREGAAPLAGLTTSPVLFCLEQLAWAHRRRVVLHVEQVFVANASAADAEYWGLRMADLVASHRPFAPPQCAGPTCAGLAPALPTGATLLTSWIIAQA